MSVFTKFIMGVALLIFLAGSGEAQYDVSKVKSENAPALSPNTTEEMQHPEFWISNLKGNPDRVILTPEQIAGLNRKNSTKPYEFKDIDGKSYTLRTNTLVEDPLAIRSFSGDSLRVLVKNFQKALENGT
ncbi:MAG: hypothetical protein WCU00_01575, partial [Candidatus Latescibacterota bacterium]